VPQAHKWEAPLRAVLWPPIGALEDIDWLAVNVASRGTEIVTGHVISPDRDAWIERPGRLAPGRLPAAARRHAE